MEGYRSKTITHDVRREAWEVQCRSIRKDKNMGNASAKRQGEIGQTLRYILEIKRRDMNENVFARPDGLRAKAGAAILWR